MVIGQLRAQAASDTDKPSDSVPVRIKLQKLAEQLEGNSVLFQAEEE